MEEKMKKNLGLILAVLLISTQAFGYSISFSDNMTVWNGWGTAEENSRDTIGIPDFTGGNVNIENGKLTSVTFQYTGPQTWAPLLWSVLVPGDLFIDINADKTWDWVVRPDVGNARLYSVSLPLNSQSGYVLSNTAWTAPGYNIRDNHPVFANNMTGSGTLVGFDGWKALTASGAPFSSTFSGLNIDINSPFIIGWTVNCSNDVVYEQINPVPEPSTMLLLSSGLVGLWGVRKRRRGHKNP